MTEQPPQEPKKKSKGLPTWVWFVGTFAVVSVAGNAVFGGNTWINSSINFVNNTIASMQVEEDTSQNDFCLTGEVSEIDKANTLTVVTEADSLVSNSIGIIGFAAQTENLDELVSMIDSVRESGPQFLRLGERILTAKDCNDPTYEFLMSDFGNALVDIGDNFRQWVPETLSSDPALLLSVTPLIENAASKAKAILTYVENLK